MSDERSLHFPCFGATVAVHVSDANGIADAANSLLLSRERLLAIHTRLSRFLPDSELSRLNRSPLRTVAASPLLCSLAKAAVVAARRSGGLVDATQLDPLEKAGYATSLEGTEAIPLKDALTVAPERRPASADPDARWRGIEIDDDAGTIRRPRGVRLDSGGIAKGMAADLIAVGLTKHLTFAVNCSGDVRVGGTAGAPRPVLVDDPFGGKPLHKFEIAEGAVATSGIGRRAWLRPDGRPAHHLLDPGTGEPAYTGIVQITALAPTGQLAEVLAKTALLKGPREAPAQLPYGGFVVYDDRSTELIPKRELVSIPTPECIEAPA